LQDIVIDFLAKNIFTQISNTSQKAVVQRCGGAEEREEQNYIRSISEGNVIACLHRQGIASAKNASQGQPLCHAGSIFFALHRGSA